MVKVTFTLRGRKRVKEFDTLIKARIFMNNFNNLKGCRYVQD